MEDLQSKIIELSTRLAEAALKNTATIVATKLKTIKAKKNDKEAINELEQIIQELIADKNELTQIAQSYEQELSTQKMTDKELDYVTNSLIPTVEKFAAQMSQSNAQQKEQMDAFINALKPIVSIETLTILQLLGFNFKKAIGEPLTLLLQHTILSKVPTSSLQIGELQVNDAIRETELLKVVQNPEAFERLQSIG